MGTDGAVLSVSEALKRTFRSDSWEARGAVSRPFAGRRWCGRSRECGRAVVGVSSMVGGQDVLGCNATVSWITTTPSGPRIWLLVWEIAVRDGVWLPFACDGPRLSPSELGGNG